MRVLVCGGRDYWDRDRVERVLNSVQFSYGFSTIIQGGASGADTLAKEYAIDHEIPFEEYKADWYKYGRGAGPIRNKQMLEEGMPDLVVAFPGGKGTANMVEQAKAAGVKVIEITL